MRGIAAIGACLAVATASLAGAQLMPEASQLLQAKRQAAIAARRSRQLDAQAARAQDQASEARARAAAVAGRVQAAEADISAAEARVRLVERLRVRQRSRLAAKQGPIVRLAGALQTMARRPAALTLIQPGSIDDLVHVRVLLASTIPAVQARTAALRAELAEAERLRTQAAQALALLRASQDRLRAERLALARIETEHRRRSQALTDSAMIEQDRAEALGEQARDILDLMQKIEAQAELGERLAELPGPLLRPAQASEAALPARDAGILRTSRQPYRLPVVGRLVTGLGEVSESGIRSRGLTLATRPQAQVIAPNGGRIAFSGPFKGYAQIVIIDHGGGWTSLLTGLGETIVRVGERVDQGSPIGRMPAARPFITVELRRGRQPIDITPLVTRG